MTFIPPYALRALSSRNYRIFFTAQIVSLTGLWMHRIAMGWLVYRLTGSNSALGVMDFAASFPIFLFTAFAGALIERWDLRRTLFFCQAGCMAIAMTLAFLTFTDLVTFHTVIFMCLMLGMIDAFELPCRYSLVSYLVDRREDVSNAVALNSTVFNAARLIGPTIGGFLIHAVGESVCFLINGLAYSVTMFAVRMMKMERPPIGRTDGKTDPIADTAEGLKLVKGFAPVRCLLILIAITGFFSFPSIVLMPAMARGVLGGTSKTLGLLLMGVAIGALSGSFFLASLKSTAKLARLCTRMCVGFGISVLLFSFSRGIFSGMLFSALLGFSMVTSTISCNTLLQSMVPRESRSRVMALYTFAIIGVPPFGSLLAGKMGDTLGTCGSLFICGVCCSVLAFFFMRKIDKLDAAILAALQRQGAA